MWPEGFPYEEEQVTEPVLLPFQIHSPTSIEAAKSVKVHASNLRERVFTAIANAVMGLTDEECALETGLAGNTVRPRRVELQRAGRIVAAGTRPTSSGRKAVVWTVKR